MQYTEGINAAKSLLCDNFSFPCVKIQPFWLLCLPCFLAFRQLM